METQSDEPAKIEHPPSLRLKLWFGKFFGYFFVPEDYVRVIYRESQYYEVRGPGLARYKSWSERLGPLVYTGGQFTEYSFANLLTSDIIPVTIKLTTIVRFDPRACTRDIARSLTAVPRQAYISIAESYLRWALMAAINRYEAADLANVQTLVEIAQTLEKTAGEEMAFLGLVLSGRVQITNVVLPRTLAERRETIAQRRASILENARYHPAEMRRALVTEVLESIAKNGPGDALINFGELLQSYAEAHGEPLLPPIIDIPPQPDHLSGAPPKRSTPPDADGRGGNRL